MRMTKTVLITGVTRRDANLIEAGLRAEGFATTAHPSHGRLTVIGMKAIASAREAVRFLRPAAAPRRRSVRSPRTRPVASSAAPPTAPVPEIPPASAAG